MTTMITKLTHVSNSTGTRLHMSYESFATVVIVVVSAVPVSLMAPGRTRRCRR